MTCPRCSSSLIYADPRFAARYCGSCYFRWTWTPSGKPPTMQRLWLPASVRQPDAKLELYPKTPDDFDLIEKIIRALDVKDSPDACIACGGSTLSSRGTVCIPCHGTGLQGKHEIVAARIVYEMKSFCICGSRHFVYQGTAAEPSVYTCDKCGKRYKSEKGVFKSIDVPSNTEMAEALNRKRLAESASLSSQKGKDGSATVNKPDKAVEKAPPVVFPASKPEKPALRRLVVATPQKASQKPVQPAPSKVVLRVKPKGKP